MTFHEWRKKAKLLSIYIGEMMRLFGIGEIHITQLS